ncbi:tetratricopeptide repeat protein [Flavobacterium sp. F-380]|uniref:histidine kinase n=1 Tax=Flavobacterium kayseriense TaxID=2764714 RepID=A0ABR7J457_9FLAO|nr:tetratricopeptide repeat-containing sensor histidine kinase [Flavobacterium kayseriense]MBC5840310.1 tetratricopeptide repeat protein [Flavobacterium kayseriense]MBC5847020.1 tetratricopeptide repeat protein [Flavobacterium kayseriense]
MRSTQYFYLTLLLVIFLSSCTQKESKNNIVDSSSDSLDIYFSLANDLNLPRDDRQTYSVRALDVVSNLKNDSINRVNLFKVANRFYNISNWKDFNNTVRLVLENSTEANDSVSIAKAFTYLGNYYESNTSPDSAFIFYNKAERIYDDLKDKMSLGKILFNKANLQYYSGDFLGAEKEVFHVLRTIKEEKQANNILYDSYNLLGILYVELGEYDNAIIYHNKALAIIDDSIMPEEFQSRATSYNNLGFLYLNSKKYLLAKEYFQKGLEQKNLLSQKPYVYSMLLDNFAYAKFKLEESKQLPDLFFESLNLRDSLNIVSGIFINKIHLSEFYASRKDTVKAIQYSKEALQSARETNVARDVLVALKQLALIEPTKAVIYNKEYIRINEQLQKEERKMGDKFSRIEYETDQIKDQNSSLELQNKNLAYALSFLTILGLSTYIIKTQKTKNRELLYKQQQQKANEDIYNLMISQQNTIESNRVQEKKRVAQELHDGVLGRMFGVRMNLDSLNKFQDEQAIDQRNSYLSELKNIEQDIREISHDLNREKSELINNFVAIVDNLLEEQRKTFETKLVSTIDSSIKWDRVKNSSKINLYRIIQESLQNCNKYAKATTIIVELKKKDDSIVLLIKDNGVGFNAKTKKKGIGLQNMISRTNECNGIFDISSAIGQGSTICVTIPIEQKQIPL